MNQIARVLLITPDYPPARGGIQYLLGGVVRHATRAHFRVITLGDRASITQEDGVQIHRVATVGPQGGAIAALNLAALIEAQSFRPDVVLSGHVVVAPAARMGRVPFVQYLYAKEMAHRPRLTSFAVRHASASIVLGEHGRSLAVRAGAEPDRLRAIPPGIDLPAPAPTTPRDRGPLIVCVARLEDRYKGADVLVRSLPLIISRVPNARMTLIGGGHLQSVLEALARANGCGGALRCTGRIDDAKRDSLLASATVFAMPSRLPRDSGGEGFGIVYLEAGARGTPVVAGNVGGALDAVVDGRTGILVPPEDHVALAEAITSLLLDRDLAVRLGAGGREWAERFAWSKVVPKVEDLLIRTAQGAR